jgi:hypothetical protein
MNTYCHWGKKLKNTKSQRIRLFNESEFLVCLGLIGAPEYGVKGTSLWVNGHGKVYSNWLSIMPHRNFDCFIPKYHFWIFREFLP